MLQCGQATCAFSNVALPPNDFGQPGASPVIGNDRLADGSVFTRMYPEVTLDGFTLGMFVSYEDCRDAWGQAPDGGIATLIWETGAPSYFREEIPPDPDGRWGTYAVQLDLQLTTDEKAKAYLRALLPELRPRWKVWAQSR